MMTPATFPAALAKAQPGDVLALGPGDYGSLVVYNRHFAEPVRIIAADPANPPAFTSALVRGVSGLRLEGPAFAYQPTETTASSQNVVFIDGCAGVSLIGGKVSSGPAVAGIPETATAYDAKGTVIGWPLGRGVYVQASTDVLIDGVEVFGVERGVLFYKSARVTLRNSDIHDVRRTFVLGGADDLTIANNHLHGSKPWRWGQTPLGDHGDYIALFPASGAGALQRVKVIGNRTENAPDVAILGFTFVDVDGLEITDNYVSGTDHQGLLATNVAGLKLNGNQFTGRAQILLRYGTVGARGANNLYAGLADYSKGAGDNVVAPSGYVAPAPPTPPPADDPRDGRIAALEAILVQIRDIAIAKRASRRVGPWDDVRAITEAALACGR